MHPLVLHEMARARHAEFERDAAQARLARRFRAGAKEEPGWSRAKMVVHSAGVAALVILVAAVLF